MIYTKFTDRIPLTHWFKTFIWDQYIPLPLFIGTLYVLLEKAID